MFHFSSGRPSFRLNFSLEISLLVYKQMNLRLFFIAEDSCKKYEETLSTEQEPTVE